MENQNDNKEKDIEMENNRKQYDIDDMIFYGEDHTVKSER